MAEQAFLQVRVDAAPIRPPLKWKMIKTSYSTLGGSKKDAFSNFYKECFRQQRKGY